ncbi:MAG: NAD(P)H-hydrate epimerase, partial [Tsuneonella sp.]
MTDAVLTAAEMRAAEQAVIDAGTSVDELMRRAGRGAAEWVWRVAAGSPVTVLCGPGNNGGDGYVIAETLRERDLEVRVVAPLEPTTDAAQSARTAWRGETTASGEGARGAVLVDCLFGSGLSRPLSDNLAALLTGLAERHEATVAIDLPSGVTTDSGALLGPAPDCALTLALGAWKPAHFLMPAMATMGRRELVPIGVTPPPESPQLLTRPHIKPPGPADHTFTRGLVVVVGGPLSGASQLACAAALRAGAGAVRLSARVVHPAMPPDVVLRDDPLEGVLSDKRTSAVLVGPGLGRDQQARAALDTALEAGFPTVIDADALRLLGEKDVAPLAGRAILTPHEG